MLESSATPTDALGDLVRAALLLATSAFSAEVRLDCEPGEWRIILDEGWKADLRRRVRALHGVATEEDAAPGEILIVPPHRVGPFSVTSVRFGERIELERNEAWYGDRLPWDQVSYRQITNEASQSGSLLAGDVDFINQVPTANVARLRGEAKVRLSEADSLRVVYIAMDHFRTGSSPFITDNDGKLLELNPLKDVRVRRALSLAIDHAGEVERVMEGIASPTLQFMAPGTFGYVPDLVPPRVNVAEAKRLLTEAGYPQGFKITLHGPNDRYPNDYRIVQAMAQVWTRAGVKTAVDTGPYASFITRASRQEFSAFLVSWARPRASPAQGSALRLPPTTRRAGWGR